MTPAVEQLVRDTMELVGADAPELFRDGAPVLVDSALTANDYAPGDPAADNNDDGDNLPGEDFYLVGIIGGKDVGKSALVNALVGRDITAITSYGPGTEIAIAYVHSSRESRLRQLLDREVPGKFRVIVHELPELQRQVLLDLPDIDSVYESHLVVTRQMLRHMLFPVWTQSIEKYADQAPQQMLAQVSAGNDARNFIFCLTKADQLDAHGAERAASELREDFGRRIIRTTGITKTPAVYVISSRRPERYDMPKLRTLLTKQKSKAAVRESQELAARRQDKSLLDWLVRQDLPAKADRLGRLLTEADETVSERVLVPLVEEALPKITQDPANRLALSDEILAERVSRWPLVTLVHTLMAPLMLMLRAVSSKNPAAMLSADALVDLHLRGEQFSVRQAIQSAFAQLRQSHPPVGDLYQNRRLWEEMPAEEAAGLLSRQLAATVDRQRQGARDRLAPRGGWLWPGRWLLTLGALIWFPIAQPVLQAVLARHEGYSFTEVVGLLVTVLGVDYLLKSVGFLVVWFIILWLALRWNTHRRVAKLLGGWRAKDDADPDLSLAARSTEWAQALTDPIRVAHGRVKRLSDRATELKDELQEAA